MSELAVRDFTEADLGAVAALWAEVFGYPEARNAPEKVIEAKLAWDGRLLCAVRGTELLGTLMFGYDGHRGWLYRAAVAPRARRQGVGRVLVQSAEALLGSLGCTKINLQLHAHNTEGVRFWEALGYACEPRISMGKSTP